MQRFEKIQKFILYTAAVLFCMVLVSSWLLTGLYARYTTTVTGSDNARVALFGHSESINLSNDISEKIYPGNSVTYNLTVSNQSEKGISEVSQSYNIEVVTAGNLPITYTLKKDAQVIGTAFQETADKKSNVFATEDMNFQAGKEESVKYTLTAEWPSDKNDSSLAGIPDFITVNINVTQTD